MLLLQEVAVGFDLRSMWEGLVAYLSARWWQILMIALLVWAWLAWGRKIRNTTPS